MSEVKEVQEQLAILLDQPDSEARERLGRNIAKGAIPGKMRLLGNQILAVGLSIDRWTVDGQCAGLVLHNNDDRDMVWQLLLGCKAHSDDDLPLTAIVDDGQQREEITFTTAGSRRVDLPPVPPNGSRLVIINTDKTWTPGTHDQRQLGVSVDVTPTGTLETLLEKPDPDKRAKLTDEIARESFSGKIRLLGNQIVATGLSLDHWTEDGVPAGVIYTNYEDREVSPELLFTCHAPADDLPLTLHIEDGKRRRRYVFKQDGYRQITLPPVSPHSKRLYIIYTDKTWSPGSDDPRKLGVCIDISPEWTLRSLQQKPDAYIRVKLAEVIANESIAGKVELLSDFIIAVGLTGDHWTMDHAPAAVVVTNVHDQEVVPKLVLGCNAGPDVLPLTASIDDGQSVQELVYEQPGNKLLTLKPVPQHSRRLYIISTDKTWSPGGGDKRELGVSVDISPGGMLTAFQGRQDPKIWSKAARSVASREMPGRMNLNDPRVMAVGLSPDQWTLDGEPAGVVISNLDDYMMAWEMELGCHADPDTMPVTVTVEDGERVTKVLFSEAGSQLVTLSPVPADDSRLYIVASDKTWSPGSGDERKLGVLVQRAVPSVSGTLAILLEGPQPELREWVEETILEQDVPGKLALEHATAVGLTGDQWTGEKGPAGLVVKNESDEELELDLRLTCHAQPSSLPLVALVDDGEDKQELRFNEAGTRTIDLPVMSPNSQQLIIIGTDSTWSPGTPEDQRQLGVQVEVVKP